MKIELKIPEVGESITEVTVGNWLKEDGEFVEQDEPVCEIESEKATVEVNAEEAGVLSQNASEGDTLEVGSVIGYIDTDSKAAKKEKTEEEDSEKDNNQKQSEKEQETEKKKSEKKDEPEHEQEKEKKDESQDKSKSKISPVAANILNEAGIDISEVNGSGEGGRITKKDAMKVVSDQKADKSEIKDTGKKSGSEERSERRTRMTTLRKTISRRLLEAKHGTAMLTTFNEIDMSHVIEVRKQYKEIFKEKHGIGLGFMSFFSKACCHALKEEEGVNAQIDGDEIVYHDYCDIGIAVSTDKGLVVPVIRNADKLTMAEIEKEINSLASKARDGKLSIDEMSGGTFSITNGGVFGSLMATPIINAPQSAILGMHAIKERAVVVDGEIVVRPMMYIALSYDHRIVDGKESVTFLKRVKELIEDPVRLILDV